jgi:hypothetical protein
MTPFSRLPTDQAEVSFDTWYDLRAGLSTTRPGHQDHRAAAKAMFDLQETDTSEPREYRNYPFLFVIQSLVERRGSIKIPARFVCRFRTASYPRAIMRVAIRRFFQDEVPT